MAMELDLTGQTLGAYRIIEQIGRGGMAIVYKAFEPALERYVAIKVLPQYFAHDPDFAARFEREAKSIARLDHPNILPIHNFGQERGLSYIVMRYVEAGTLKDMLNQPLDLRVTIEIMEQVGAALDYAHSKGVVHRDVKPSNVLMAQGGWALLTDFGLARMVETSTQITKSGVGVGTPAYMSPEQGKGLKVDARSDVYSLGIMLYEMVTGRVPFEAETPMAVVLKHITAPLPLPRSLNPNLSEAVEKVILKALAKEPDDRYQTAGEMVKALKAAVAETPVVSASPLVQPHPGEEVPSDIATTKATLTTPTTFPAKAPSTTWQRLSLWVCGIVAILVCLIMVLGTFVVTRRMRLTSTLGTTTTLVPSPTLPVSVEAVVSPVPPTVASISPTPILMPLPDNGKVVEQCEGISPPQLCVRDIRTGQVTRVTENLEFGSIDRPVWSSNGQQIAFSAGSDYDVTHQYDHQSYIINVDGSSLRQITSGDEHATHPAISPNGEWVVFLKECDLWLVHPDGSDKHVVLRGMDNWCAWQVVWSPDSQHLAFVDGETDGREVWVVNLDGSGARELFAFEGQPEWAMVGWSPNGRGIAYLYSEDGQSKALLLPVEGRGEPQVIAKGQPWWWLPDFWPLWGVATDSPAPVSPKMPEEGKLALICEDIKPPQLCVEDFVSGQVSQVTEDLGFEAVVGPAWSPDGQLIVFSAGSDWDVTGRYDHQLYVINVDGSDLRKITSGDGNTTSPSWSPDGEWIAFMQDCGLGIIRPDGSNYKMLVRWREGLCIDVIAWEPEGQRLAFTNGDADFREVWVVNFDGSDPHVIFTFQRLPDWAIVGWSPDGRQIAYTYYQGDKSGSVFLPADGSGEPQLIEDLDLWWWLPDFWPPWGIDPGG